MSQDRRCLSCWPLLGHWSTYPSSLREILITFQAGQPQEITIQQLIDTGQAKTRTQALKLRNYLTGMGFLDPQTQCPTPPGTEYLQTLEYRPIQETLRTNLKFVSEIEVLLSERQMTISSLIDELKLQHGVPWESDWQIRFRLNWMRAFGIVTRLSEKESTGRYPEWRLTQK